MSPIQMAIGAMVDQTGALSGIVDAVSEPLNMAVAEINAVSPDLVSVEFADDGTDQTVAGTNIEAFLDGSKNAVMGPLASGVAASVWDKVNTAHMVMCSGTSTGSAFSAPEYDPNHVRTAPSDDIQGPLLGNIVVEDGNANVAVSWRQDVYGEGFGNALADAVEAAGATVVYREGYDPEAGSYTDVAQDIVASGADALALISFAEGGQIVQDLAAAGWDGQTYVADGFVDNIKADTVGGRTDLVEGFKGTYPAAAPANGEATFGDRFAAFAPDAPTVFSAHQYDCFVVLTLAAQAAQSNDPAVYVDQIIGVTRDGEKCSLVADCLEKVWAGVDIDYDGASGPLDFSEHGEPGIGTYDTFTYGADLALTYGEQIQGSLPEG
jgi:branched-chain amino acid transport system substrate-binding protein